MQLKAAFRHLAVLVSFFVAASCLGAVVERPLTAVPLDTTLVEAQKLADRHAGQVLKIEGQSMLPFFGEGSVVVIKKIGGAQLRPGMVVVYRNRFGETVAHRLVAPTANGWVAQGFNNAATDSTIVNDTNLMGVVYATFHSSGKSSAHSELASIVSNTPVALAAPAK